MKKIIIILLLFTLLLTGCSAKTNEVEHTYMAILLLPDGSIVRGECAKVTRYSDSYQIVVIDGVQYWTHSWRIVVIDK